MVYQANIGDTFVFILRFVKLLGLGVTVHFLKSPPPGMKKKPLQWTTLQPADAHYV